MNIKDEICVCKFVCLTTQHGRMYVGYHVSRHSLFIDITKYMYILQLQFSLEYYVYCINYIIVFLHNLFQRIIWKNV